MNRLLPIFPLAALLLATMGIGNCDSQPLGSVDAGNACAYQGQRHAIGSSFPSSDGCNTCTCDANGQIACTLIACSTGDGGQSTDGGSPNKDAGNKDGGSFDAATPICFDTQGQAIPCPQDAGTDAPKACAYDGKSYLNNSTFPSRDNCNTCSCTDGQVFCTLRLCFDAGIDSAAPGCTYEKSQFAVGATFPSIDGCNTCSCTTSGVACTEKACLSDAGRPMTGVCVFGQDQTCNEDPTISALRGKCLSDGTCSCNNTKVSSYTGRCLDPGDVAGYGCEYAGVLHAVGSSFTCADGCNRCSCVGVGKIATTDIACADGGAPICDLDAVYIYGNVGGLVAFQDQVTIAPASAAGTASYVYNRTTSGASTGVSCSPALPACQTPDLIDVADIMADVSDPIVQKYLVKTSTPMVFGIDPRAFDGTVFSFQRGDGRGFLVGNPCNGVAGCTPIPDTIARLVTDLRALDQQQIRSSSCAALAPPSFSCGALTCRSKTEYCARASVAGVDKVAACRPYPAGCSTCACALTDAAPIIKQSATCTATCTDGFQTVPAASSSPTLIAWCMVP